VRQCAPLRSRRDARGRARVATSEALDGGRPAAYRRGEEDRAMDNDTLVAYVNG
jgi:hypothetical protein